MQYDLIVIGGGPGGYVAAIRAAQYGMKTALVEARDLGGTCLNRGCVPTKALLHTANLYREIQNAATFGIDISEASVDLSRMYEKKDNTVEKLRSGISQLLKANKIDIITGCGYISKKNTVEVTSPDGETTAFQTKNILIATGSAAAKPTIDGIDLPGVVTSDDLLAAAPDFRRLLIIGGGVIGMEFASIFSALGKEVTVIEYMDRILPTMDREIAQNLSMIFKKRGVSLIVGAGVTHIEQDGTSLICNYQKGEAAGQDTADCILIATGRKPRFEHLFPASLGVKTDRGIITDDSFETSVDGIYAIGDVVDGAVQLAHAASAMGLNAVARMAKKEPPMNLTAVPACVYTDPEIATVGITADEAKRQGIETKLAKYVMSGNARSMIEDKDRGFVKLVFDQKSDSLIGAQLMCARATDIIGELSLAVASRLTSAQLESVIRAHPTFYEGISEAVDIANEHPIHTVPR